MKKIAQISFVLMLFSTVPLAAGGYEAAPADKAVVYLGRLSGFVGSMRPFHLFADEHYLARVKGKNYIRYVCDPGEHIFWVAADNRNFVQAKLQAGKSYALFAKIQAGAWTAGAALYPITEGSKDWKEFGKMIRESKPDSIDPAYIAKWEKNHPDYIEKALQEWRDAGELSVTLREDEYFEIPSP